MTFHRAFNTDQHKLTTNWYNAVATGLNSYIIGTNVTLHTEDNPPTAATDLIYLEDYWASPFCGYTWWSPSGGTMVGYTYCYRLSGSKCDQFQILFNKNWDLNGNVTQTQRQNFALHETGHSLGLTHGSPQCSVMDLCQSSFSSHDYDHINGNY